MLSSAIDAKCDFLITGDKDLLSMQKEVEAISNVSPREMWVLLNNFGLRQK
jgi:predicted nucleic acid-binding protein